MPAITKLTGRTPIRSRSRLARIDPVWVHGAVPMHFWEDIAHRRDYLLWLAHKFHFRYMEDFYRLTYGDLRRNRGTGLGGNYWRTSAIERDQGVLPAVRVARLALCRGVTRILGKSSKPPSLHALAGAAARLSPPGRLVRRDRRGL